VAFIFFDRYRMTGEGKSRFQWDPGMNMKQVDERQKDGHLFFQEQDRTD
jgi:hypothetical protein